MLNLLMAVIWLLVGIGLFAWNSLYPDRTLRIQGTNFSFAWLVLVLALYNLARWWSTQSFRREQRAMREAYMQRQRDYQRERPEPLPEPDPNFDFSKPPSQEIQERPPQ